MTTLLAALLLAAATTAAPTLPATDTGRRAQAWLEAYNAGEEATRAFLKDNVSPESLQRRPLDERVAVMRSLREQHGRFTLAKVGEVAADRISLEVKDEHGAALSVDLLFDAQPPHLMAGARIMDGGGGRPPGPAAPSGPPMTEEQVASALRDHLAARGDGFSGAVLLAHGDRILLREAKGLASRAPARPNTPETRFNLGSINKAFTRLAVEQLAAAGKLSLSDTLDRWVPEYPVDKGRRITIQQLIDHRAGTGDFFGPRYDAADHAKLLSLRDWLPLIADEPLRFEPGSREDYSNAGYLLLGLAVEKASGQSYFDYVRDHIFAPAGMKDSGWYTRAEGGERLAIGYTTRGGTATDNRATLPARGTSAGGGYSTLDDLLRFAQALRRGAFGPAEAGIMVAGGAPGINASLVVEGDWTAVVLANIDPPAAESVGMQVEGWLRRAGAGPAGGVRRVVRAGGAEDEHGRPRKTEIPEGGVDLPMQHAGHLPAVQVMVNGQGPFLFAFDTGGAGTLRLNKSLADRLGLKTVGEVRAGDPSGLNMITMPMVEVASVEIAGAKFSGLVASVRADDETGRHLEADGILGFGLFADTLVTLDYPGERFRITKGALPAPDGREVLPFTADDGIPSITISVGGRTMSAHVDAGSMGGIILPESQAASLPLSAPLKVIGRARTVTNTFEIKGAPLDGDVVIGGITLSRPMLEFQPIMPFANVGSRVLKDLAITFDQANHRLRIVGRRAPE